MTIIKQSNGRWWNVNDIWWMFGMDGVAFRITLFLVFILLVEKSQMNRNVSLVFNLRRRIYCLEFWIWFTHIHTDRQRYKCPTYLLWVKQRPTHECVHVLQLLRLMQLLGCYLLEIRCMLLDSFHSGLAMYHSVMG